ncbi:MAG: nicotinate phosphoribosyltransferase [Alphaproteobacteria bacterium]|nr:nicotinate phosphoribosyltransferase [Alphaproteobacteria bacterium]MCB9929596.1 nicotinate phosphoribosyltransferase [Alphaproteobacteria bacterium]
MSALKPANGATVRPTVDEVPRYTDAYFRKTKAVVGGFGDVAVTYAVFMRRPVVCCPRLAVEWLQAIAASRGVRFEIELTHAEGEWVGAGEPLMYLSGSLFHLVDLETLYLQKLGAACVAAYNAYEMCKALPRAAFLAMDARHCAGTDMADLMAYAASVGSAAAKREVGAVGFVGNATDATAHYFGQPVGFGTMPHALIGYAGSTLKAAQMFHATHPDDNLTVLVDYYGQEVSDSLAVCRAFPELAAAGRLAFRLDTHGGRYVEGLDTQTSYAVLDRNAPEAIRQFRSESELRYLNGTGVSAAAVWHLRERLDEAGFPKARIVASSGFGVEKCRAFAVANTPVDLIGTGSFLPERWGETYATADIIEYDGKPSVKVGREFLLRQRAAHGAD